MLNKRHHRTLILTHYFQIMTKREINQSGRFTETTLQSDRTLISSPLCSFCSTFQQHLKQPITVSYQPYSQIRTLLAVLHMYRSVTGVPHGSVLGPFLFARYTTSLGLRLSLTYLHGCLHEFFNLIQFYLICKLATQMHILQPSRGRQCTKSLLTRCKS